MTLSIDHLPFPTKWRPCQDEENNNEEHGESDRTTLLNLVELKNKEEHQVAKTGVQTPQ